MRYAKGICWVDDTRIPFVDEKEIPKKSNDGFKNWASYYQRDWKGNEDLIPNTQGRFTPNLLVCDDMLNDGSVSNSTGGIPNGKSVYGRTSYNESSTINTQTKVGFGDKGSNSRYYDLDKWFDKVIDEIR